jgi:hypothetical protein
MWLQGDLDERRLLAAAVQAHFPVDETDETLHAIQNGLKLQLNG